MSQKIAIKKNFKCLSSSNEVIIINRHWLFKLGNNHTKYRIKL